VAASGAAGALRRDHHRGWLDHRAERRPGTFGFARIDGSFLDFVFRIDVQDLAEPGVGQDTYRIRLSNGYDSGGGAAGPAGPGNILMGGNVQIHFMQ
jgi:hypothetical protein